MEKHLPHLSSLLGSCSGAGVSQFSRPFKNNDGATTIVRRNGQVIHSKGDINRSPVFPCDKDKHFNYQQAVA
jgi:hypothetical protein